MLVLGVDPGLRRTGFGLVEGDTTARKLIHHEVVCSPPSRSVADCLAGIGDRVAALLDEYRPDTVAVEKIYVGKDPQGAFKVGQVRGVIIYLASVKGFAVAEYPPATVKQAVVGYGQATKQQVKFMMSKMLNCPEKISFDETDALAIALCHLSHHRFERCGK